jgi:hypothetical protein
MCTINRKHRTPPTPISYISIVWEGLPPPSHCARLSRHDARVRYTCTVNSLLHLTCVLC